MIIKAVRFVSLSGKKTSNSLTADFQGTYCFPVRKMNNLTTEITEDTEKIQARRPTSAFSLYTFFSVRSVLRIFQKKIDKLLSTKIMQSRINSFLRLIQNAKEI